ncbi:hypothetical protein DF152_17075 [Burkholderia cenocepacia]|nr:hypothetical protein DF152_17075 [Burkholderia cenocepacia]
MTVSSEVASGVQAASAVGTAAYSITKLPLSEVAACVSILLSLVYMWGALPRWWRTTKAFFHGIRSRDMSEWEKLGDQPMQEKED